MSTIYPPNPEQVPNQLAQPRGKYRRQAWFALLGLTLFLLLYLSLTGWFVWTAGRLLYGAFRPDSNLVPGLLAALPAAFLALFMLKALFFVKRGRLEQCIELTPREQPQLFAFLNRLADEAGAPRPHRVFASPRVNAAVFFDLSILNFFFPSKKNLEIGLGLVNALNLGELKAVLAHEFGHFAQRSMAVGSWVYVAQQIAAHLVAHRDGFDRFVQRLSRIDLRIAWIGWLLGLVIWSIRAVMDSLFSLVVLAERALAREMEFQADLVAVKLTGSDALIHALHTLHAADDAWARALRFAESEAGDGRSVSDLFAIQRRLLQILRTILGDPAYGKAPPLPQQAENHRLFQAAVASPPKMWSTHPENFAREENAKKTYIATAIDERSAWSLFRDPARLRALVSAQALDPAGLEMVDIRTSLARLDASFSKIYFADRFKGTYLGREVTRASDSVRRLYADYTQLHNIDQLLDGLYPAALPRFLDRLRDLYRERATLQGVHTRTLQLNDRVIRHRGQVVNRKQLPKVIDDLGAEIAAMEQRVRQHDLKCRTVHLALAYRLGKGWEQNLKGLLGLLHYAEHREANLRDLQGYLSNVVAVITADNRVSSRELKRLLAAANEVYAALAEVYAEAGRVELGSLVRKQLQVEDWQSALGDLELVPATRENINEWMNVIDGWLTASINALSTLSSTTLEQLLKTETHLAKVHRQQLEITTAPGPPKPPATYPTFVHGSERQRQTRLGLWDRFYTASGPLAATFRFAVATSVVAAVVYVGQLVGGCHVTIYNGLASTVEVNICDRIISVAPGYAAQLDLPPGSEQQVSTTINGQLVEAFTAETGNGFGDYVYNVGQGMALFEWTQVYGNAAPQPGRYLGAPRWLATSAQVKFAEPPTTVRTKGGGATRRVLSAMDDLSPSRLADFVKDPEQRAEMIRRHVIWDDDHSAYMFHWIQLAADEDDILALARERLKHYPYDVVALRLLQDYAADAKAYAAICRDHTDLAQQFPNNADFQYLAVRCLGDDYEQALAFIQGAIQWPDNPWFHFAASHTFIEQGDWINADRAATAAMSSSALFRENLAIDALRLKRLLGTADDAIQARMARGSDALAQVVQLETGEGMEDSPYRFYSLLNRGELDIAAEQLPNLGESSARGLRLLAASEGAPRQLVRQAGQLTPEQGVDLSTVWLGWATAVKAGADSTPYEKLAEQMQDRAPQILRILKRVERKGAFADFDKALQGMDLEDRGHTYTAAILLLGKRAPEAWKRSARAMLYAYERPYYKI